MESNKITITLVSPLQRKWCLWEYFRGIRILFESNPDVTFKWIIHDNSRNKKYNKVVREEAEEIKNANPNVDTLVYHINDTNYCDTDALNRGNVGDIMVKIYNICFGLADWESDYGMIIEDDILVTQTDALRLLLNAFDEETGTVAGASFNRTVLAHSNSTKVTTQHWNFVKHKNGTVLATQIEPQDTGITEIEMTANSFWLARFDLIKTVGFGYHEKINGADRSWCMRTKDIGFKTKVVWDIKARHYYKAPDGTMGFINYNKAKLLLEKKEPQFTVVQTDRKSSPQFIKKMIV